jgi:hypothetical protein
MNAAGSDAGAAAAGGGVPKPAKVSKPRLPSLDSLRFFLIAYIGVGHFVAFATKDAFLLKLFSQVRACAAFDTFSWQRTSKQQQQ